ncbi:MAG: NAD-dependent epimerase/dehydratase family protein [Acidimicrobiales bacterium]
MQKSRQVHVIVGAGPVGSATAELLVAADHHVRIITRSGAGPEHPRVERVAANAADHAVLGPLTKDAAVIYNCANPAYTRWPLDWPPLAASLLAAAEGIDAVLVTTSNLYAYGPVDHPMTESDPMAATGPKGRVRAQMWNEAEAAHDAGRIRATEARASDFFGPGVTGSVFGERVMPRLLAGKTLRFLGDPDAPHSLTYGPDVARALVVLGADERAWGRPWHVPTGPALSMRATTQAAARASGAPTPKVGVLPPWAMKVGALVSPMIRELQETAYQFDRPFVLDSTAFTATFGWRATPLDEALAATSAWWQERAVAA